MDNNKKFLDQDGLKKVFEIIEDQFYTKDEVDGLSTGADWNAQDGEAGFIKNKPFGEIVGDYEIIHTEDLGMATNTGSYYMISNTSLFKSSEELDANIEYTIRLGDKVFILNPKYIGGQLSFTDSSNTNQTNGPIPQDGSFWLIVSPSSGQLFTTFDCSNVSLSISCNKKYIKKVDSKYLPITQELSNDGENTILSQTYLLNYLESYYLRRGEIVQKTGNSKTSVMSQGAVTEALANIGGSSYPANNQIIYFSIDNQKLDLASNERFKDTVETIVSNEYDSYGVITFKEDITVLPNMYKIFEDITKVVELVLPNCITEFSQFQFQGMLNLHTVNIPNNLTSLPLSCFDTCYNLHEIRLPKGIKEIPDSCFFGCRSLMSLNLENIETIGASAFRNCLSLTSVNLPNLTTFNGENQFYDCHSLSYLNFRDINGSVKLTSIPICCFYGHSIKNIEIPSTITSIGSNAFYPSGKINSVTFNSDILFDIPSIISGNVWAVKYYVNYSTLKQYRDRYPYYWGAFYVNGYDNATAVYQNQLWTGTQDEYDAIVNKDANTFYFIKEEEE